MVGVAGDGLLLTARPIADVVGVEVVLGTGVLYSEEGAVGDGSGVHLFPDVFGGGVVVLAGTETH